MTMKKRIYVSLLVLLVGLMLCGFNLFNSSEVAIDTVNNKVYRYVTVDKIISDFKSDEKRAVDNYNNGYYLLSGTIESISKKGDSIKIYGSSKSDIIVCPCNKFVRADILNYSPGDNVALYGQISVDVFDKESHLKVEKIIKAPKAIMSSEIYYTLGGSMFDFSKSRQKSLANGRVEYRIPDNWREIEIDVKENGLGTIEGYQYVLNKLPGNENAVPESLFVTYFDKSLLKDKSDIKNIKEVEKVIIKNIEKNVNRFPIKTVSTYYNQKYKYYIGKYTDKLDLVGYRTEYVFIDDADKGIVMLLYVYREPEYADDVMFVTRFLEIK